MFWVSAVVELMSKNLSQKVKVVINNTVKGSLLEPYSCFFSSICNVHFGDPGTSGLKECLGKRRAGD